MQQIEAEAAAKRQASGIGPVGRDAILRQTPETRPSKSKKSPAPRFHAFTKRVRRELYEAYAWFVATFREAAEKLKAGNRNASFPTGSFPPHLPFVRDLRQASRRQDRASAVGILDSNSQALIAAVQ